MRWVDVCGPPGAGKSTLCDPIWGPHALPIEDKLPPAEWHDFLNEITRLFYLIHAHPSFDAAVRMNNRSVRKIATVARETLPGPYVQTALAQRGLGFGWRLVDMGVDVNELRHYFRLMPVSIGVALLECDPEIVKQRNHARKLVAETAHEDRAHMVDLMQPAIGVAMEVLSGRRVSWIRLDMQDQSIEDARAKLIAFAGQDAGDAEAAGPGSEVAVLSPPPWWL